MEGLEPQVNKVSGSISKNRIVFFIFFIFISLVLLLVVFLGFFYYSKYSPCAGRCDELGLVKSGLYEYQDNGVA